MNTIDRIVQVLEENSDDIITSGHHELSVLESGNFKDIAEIIVKNLALSDVVKSLPTVKEKNIELSHMLENFYGDEEIYFKKEAKFGFNYCFKYVRDNMNK